MRQSLHDALLDPDQGLFGNNRIQIGKAYFNSDIYSACLAVPGVLAVHNLFFDTRQFVFLKLPFLPFEERMLRQPVASQRPAILRQRQPTKMVASGQPAPRLSRLGKGAGRAMQTLCILERYNPGEGNYFSLPDDGAHLTLNAELSS